MPFVFRRAAFDVQITDPASGDILQLDQGTWVMSSAAPNPRTRTLNVYTTDPDTGLVLHYELPIPDGNLNNVFDRHTLNPIETMGGGGAGGPGAQPVGESALDDESAGAGGGGMDQQQLGGQLLDSAYAM